MEPTTTWEVAPLTQHDGEVDSGSSDGEVSRGGSDDGAGGAGRRRASRAAGAVVAIAASAVLAAAASKGMWSSRSAAERAELVISAAEQWKRHEGVNCYPGAGGLPTPSGDQLQGEVAMADCTSACEGEPACEGVVVLRGRDPGPCWLRSKLSLADCPAGTDYDLWAKPHAASEHEVASEDPDSASQGIAEFKPGTTTRATPEPEPLHSADGASIDTGAKSSADDDESETKSWLYHSGLNCIDSRGGDALLGPDELNKDTTIQRCKAVCARTPLCEGVQRMHGLDVGPCLLRTNLNIVKCVFDTPYDLYVHTPHAVVHTPAPTTEQPTTTTPAPAPIFEALASGIDSLTQGAWYATSEPTPAPTEGAEETTQAPTDAPTYAPTEAPTDAPTEAPTGEPTGAPTAKAEEQARALPKPLVPVEADGQNSTANRSKGACQSGAECEGEEVASKNATLDWLKNLGAEHNETSDRNDTDGQSDVAPAPAEEEPEEEEPGSPTEAPTEAHWSASSDENESEAENGTAHGKSAGHANKTSKHTDKHSEHSDSHASKHSKNHSKTTGSISAHNGTHDRRRKASGSRKKRKTTITTTSTTTTKTKGSPSLYCFAVIRKGTYEVDVMRLQSSKGAGIYGCDEHLVMGDDSSLGKVIDLVEAGVSKDGTSANVATFLNAWRAVGEEGRYREFEFTIKADPDTVFMPEVLRQRLHLNPLQLDDNVFIPNCDLRDRYPDSPDFPMMLGSLEVLSRKAVDTWLEGQERCKKEMPWQEWGEDLYLGKCLTHLGTKQAGDYGLLQDSNCRGVDCRNFEAAAFHCFKSAEEWEDCWNQASHARARALTSNTSSFALG